MHEMYAQSKNFAKLKEEINYLKVPSSSFDALEIIDSCLHLEPSPFTQEELTYLEVSRVEALQESNQLDLALSYSRDLLKSKGRSPHAQAEIHLWRALCYEILGDFRKCKAELDKCQKLINDAPSEHIESTLLYRSASYHRLKPNPNTELAIECATRSKKLALKSGNVDAAAISSLILGFYSEGKEHEEDVRETLKYWIEINDIQGVGYTFNSLADIYLERNDIDSALIYCDSAIFYCQRERELRPKSGLEGALAFSFMNKSEMYERKGMLDSSIVYLKKFHEYSSFDAHNKLVESVKRLEYSYAQEEQTELIESQKKEISAKRKEKRSLIAWIILLGGLVLVILYLLKRLVSSRKKIIENNQQLDNQNSELQLLVKEKETLFMEVNHRVKNNLTMILSLMEVQIENSDNQEMKERVNELRQRIYAIAGTHNALIGEYKNGSHSEFINIEKYVDIIIEPYQGQLTATYDIDDQVKLKLVKGVPFGILINELITNSVKHAKPESGKLAIDIEMRCLDSEVHFTYSDNGKVFHEKTESSVKGGLGSYLIRTMARQLKGKLKRSSSTYTLQFRLN